MTFMELVLSKVEGKDEAQHSGMAFYEIVNIISQITLIKGGEP